MPDAVERIRMAPATRRSCANSARQPDSGSPGDPACVALRVSTKRRPSATRSFGNRARTAGWRRKIRTAARDERDGIGAAQGVNGPLDSESSMSPFEPMRLGLWGAQALYLFAPLIVAAALAGLVLRFDWLPGSSRPLDGRAMFREHRVFGDGKTWRGVLVAIGGSSVSVALQRALHEYIPQAIQVVDYTSIHPLGFGASLGVGAILGELPNSFVKRQLGIPRGETTRGFLGVVFYVWDQVDTLIGAWPLLYLWFAPSLPLVIMSFAFALGLHPLIAWLGYLMGARRSAR